MTFIHTLGLKVIKLGKLSYPNFVQEFLNFPKTSYVSLVIKLQFYRQIVWINFIIVRKIRE